MPTWGSDVAMVQKSYAPEYISMEGYMARGLSLSNPLVMLVLLTFVGCGRVTTMIQPGI